MILRKYQEELSWQTRSALKRHKHVLMCSVTGSGKTAIATDYVVKASAKQLTTVFLCDRDKLIEQTHKHFTKAGISCQIVDAKTKTLYKSRVYIGMVETFHRRLSAGWFNNINIDLLILDECHIGHYNKIIEKFPETYVIGLTATPVASSKNNPLNKYYGDIVVGPTVTELIQMGYLVPSLDIGQSHILDCKVTAGEFDARSQMEQFQKYGLDAEMFRLWKQHAYDRQTIVYNINIEHNKQVVRLFDSNGVDVDFVTGDTPHEERVYKLDKYERGETQVLCNVGVYTKGFDSPQTSCIVGNFSTSSLSKWLQVVGRGARTHEDKSNFITIDMGNNLLLHGSYNDPVDWKELFKNDKRDKNFKVTKKPKLCPLCFAYIFNIHNPVCHVCGKESKASEFITLQDSMPEYLKTKPVTEMNLKELNMYGKYMGYKRGWGWMQFIKRKNKVITHA